MRPEAELHETLVHSLAQIFVAVLLLLLLGAALTFAEPARNKSFTFRLTQMQKLNSSSEL
jgi:hypothetical protein